MILRKMEPLFFLLAASVVAAQSVSDLPSCSLSCFATAVAATSCASTDYLCQCTAANLAIIKSSVTPCLSKSSCTLGDLQNVQTWSDNFCPSVLASASAASSSPTSSAISAASANPASNATPSGTSSVLAVSSVSSPSTSSLTSTSSPAVEDFGAGTSGTSWGKLPATASNANRGPAFEVVSIVLVSTAALVLLFRFFVRIYTKSRRQVLRGVGPDEWFALLALIVTAGVTADIAIGNNYGMGKHLSMDTTPGQIEAILKLVYAFVLMITVSFGVIKISILFLYLRMTPERSHKIAVYVIMGLVGAHFVTSIIGGIFQCRPISDFWTSLNTLQNPSCFDILIFDGFNNAWSALEDLVIWSLPIPVIWKLKVPFARKMGLWALVAISFISVVCAFVRMAWLVIWMRSVDISWNWPLIPFLSNMEVCVGLMTSSVPAIYPLFRRSDRKKTYSDPAPPPMGSPTKSWVSQDSHDETAVPPSSSAAGDKRSSMKRWSFLSRKTSGQSKAQKHVYLSTATDSEYGQRTELKSVFEAEEIGDFIPGLAK